MKERQRTIARCNITYAKLTQTILSLATVAGCYKITLCKKDAIIFSLVEK